MQCINELCSNEAVGRSKYCGNACKVAYNRNKSVAVTVTESPKSVTVTPAPVTVCPGPEHYYANPDMYAQRTAPETLNWGPWMDMVALGGSTLKANRVSIPGDHDYAGDFA